MAFTIFYSWQSDRPSSVNRNFIESVLKKVVRNLKGDITIQNALRDEEVELDKDTQGVSGSPPITDTIFNKISECSVFVPDLTFVGEADEGRLLMNPNVLIEYGWALKEVTHTRIVSVMNTEYGKPSGKTLPFDMRHLRRPYATYCLPEDATPEQKSKVKQELLDKLTKAIELVIKNNPIEKTTEGHEEIPWTTKRSTFLKPDEKFLDKGRFDLKGTELILPDNEHLFLHIIPSKPEVNIKTSMEALNKAEAGNLRPMGVGYPNMSFGRNTHGSYVYARDDDKILNLTQLFKTGELWGIDAYTIDKKVQIKHKGFGFFPSSFVESIYCLTLTNYLKFAKETLKLKPPLKFIAGATGVEGYKMMAPNGTSFGGFEKFRGDVVENEIIYNGVIEDYGIDATDILQPFFEHLWEECGLKR